MRLNPCLAVPQAFIERCNALVTCSKDGYVRAWDLGTQHCFQITLGQQGEVSACKQLAFLLNIPSR